MADERSDRIAGWVLRARCASLLASRNPLQRVVVATQLVAKSCTLFLRASGIERQAVDQPHGFSDNRNLTWQAMQPREARWRALGQRPVIAWLTGLSGAGKSTIAMAVDRALTEAGRAAMVIDGDNLRHGLNKDLGFTEADRIENIRRAAETARLMAEAGLVTVVSLISPFRTERAAARATAGDIPFLEIFIDTPLKLCEARDPKGLYVRARSGEIPNFTGVSAPYQAPARPDLTLSTAGRHVTASAQPLIDILLRLSAPRSPAARSVNMPAGGSTSPGMLR